MPLPLPFLFLRLFGFYGSAAGNAHTQAIGVLSCHGV